MDRIRRSLRQSFRRSKKSPSLASSSSTAGGGGEGSSSSSSGTHSHQPPQWQGDENAVRAAACSFQVKVRHFPPDVKCPFHYFCMSRSGGEYSPVTLLSGSVISWHRKVFLWGLEKYRSERLLRYLRHLFRRRRKIQPDCVVLWSDEL